MRGLVAARRRRPSSCCCRSARGASGGRTIADAPQIAFGQQQLNSLNGIDFYRVALRTGDELKVRYGPQQYLHHAEICIFQPGVTDTTVGNQPCYAAKNTFSDDSFTVSARIPGDWVIAMVLPGLRDGILDLRCTIGLQYVLTRTSSPDSRCAARRRYASRILALARGTQRRSRVVPQTLGAARQVCRSPSGRLRATELDVDAADRAFATVEARLRRAAAQRISIACLYM